MSSLTKSKILLHRQCPRRLWLQVNSPDLALEDSSSIDRFRDGNAIGDVARKLHPEGIFIETLDQSDALLQTDNALRFQSIPIFEAAFLADDVLVRTDLLLPDANGYRLVEVKSSTSVKDYHYDDVKVQVRVMNKSGIHPTKVILAHVNSKFTYIKESNYQGLFEEVDISSEIFDEIVEVDEWISAAKKTLSLTEEPSIEPGNQCSFPFECTFKAHCMPAENITEFPLEILPYSKSLVATLRSEGFKDLREVPSDRFKNPKHIRVHRSSISGIPELDQEAIDILKNLPYPRYYLDFETIAFAVPIWIKTKPYVQLPFQWSCHIEAIKGQLEHREFLDTTGMDPRREFAVSLINTLGTSGPIVVYNAPFEGARMQELAADFPDLAIPLLAATSRLFDLLPVARNHYYHPAMKGSWSIKKVLPTISKELDYENLEVKDGGMAQDAYRQTIDSKITEESKEFLRRSMLEYCKHDTLAMVKIVHSWSER